MSEQRQPESPNESFEEILRRLQHQVPFEPFNIVMASGDRYRIDDPFTMVVSPVDIFARTRDQQ